MTSLEATITIDDLDGAEDYNGEPLDQEQIVEWFEALEEDQLGIHGVVMDVDVEVSDD